MWCRYFPVKQNRFLEIISAENTTVVLREEAGSLARSHALYMQELFTIKTRGFALNTLLIGRLTFSPLILNCKPMINANMDCLWKSNPTHETSSGKLQPSFFKINLSLIKELKLRLNKLWLQVNYWISAKCLLRVYIFPAMTDSADSSTEVSSPLSSWW